MFPLIPFEPILASQGLGVIAAATAGMLAAAMLLLWGIATLRRNVSLADPFWGTGFLLVAWLAFGLGGVSTPAAWLIVALTTLWGARLSSYLLWRNWGEPEDRRYADMRRHHGGRFPWVSLVTVFLLQGFLIWIVSLPIQAALAGPATLRFPLLAPLGLLLWSIGFLFESVGDWQLARFRADPANARRVLDTGLWRYTRHPNYFGDFCVWWGLYFLSASTGPVWTLLSPLLMSVLLLKVSGVSLLEKTVTDRRPDYAAYQKRTSSFFPWPPRAPGGPAGES